MKARANGSGFTSVKKWLGKHDLLFLIQDHEEPLVVMTWDVYETLILAFQRGLKSDNSNAKGEDDGRSGTDT